jgi:hypothetical protein
VEEWQDKSTFQRLSRAEFKTEHEMRERGGGVRTESCGGGGGAVIIADRASISPVGQVLDEYFSLLSCMVRACAPPNATGGGGGDGGGNAGPEARALRQVHAALAAQFAPGGPAERAALSAEMARVEAAVARLEVMAARLSEVCPRAAAATPPPPTVLEEAVGGKEQMGEGAAAWRAEAEKRGREVRNFSQIVITCWRGWLECQCGRTVMTGLQ